MDIDVDPPQLKHAVERSPQVLCGTVKILSVGLNLTRATMVALLEPCTQADLTKQTLKRVHRIGQTKECEARFLISSTMTTGLVPEGFRVS